MTLSAKMAGEKNNKTKKTKVEKVGKKKQVEPENVAPQPKSAAPSIDSTAAAAIPTLVQPETKKKKTKTAADKKKVAAKDSKKSAKLKSTAAATFISLESAADDNKTVRAPSYSDTKDRGLIYISHVPHGFYEKQMREFFSQFGTVTNLRLGRSRKSGRSKGYAFVEFKYEEVAKIAAEAMHNYLMFDKLVKCELVPQDRRSPAVFKGKVRPHRPPGKTAMFKQKKIHNAVKTDEQNQKRQVRQMNKLQKIKEKLSKAGVEYSFQVAEMSEKQEAT